MNTSFITQNAPTLKRANYIQKAASQTQYWFNFYCKKLRMLVQRRGEGICLVLNGSEESDDAYVLPFRNFKDFFSEEYLDEHGRWSGYIAGGEIRVCLNGKVKGTAVGMFHNAFHFLGHS